MKATPFRPVFVAVVVVGMTALLGGLLGGGVQAVGDRPEDRLRTFGQILSLIEAQYGEDAEAREVVESAIQGMLRELDPHSNYLPPEAFDEMKEEQRGRFYGLGIQITKGGPDKPLTIISPIDDTPAARAGLHPGDIIYKIEGDETLEMNVQDAVSRLKGPKGTSVTVTIQRPSDGSEFDVTIVRDEIPIDSVRTALMLDAETGFVSIGSFTSTTVDELDREVDNLRAQGMRRLVLDLRDNPGGLLDQAVRVSERFLPEGKLVVYTRGRIPGADQDYFAEDGGDRITEPLVVLVNRGSASASEIVSGAIQDHDRGLVVGETTFGKGLVQRVIPLRHGGALAVTTAKYYTPAGRLIQRDYSDLEDYFLSHGAGEAGEPPADGDDPPPAEEEREVFYTASGRTVYGGGGITPDHVVRSQRLPALLSRMLRANIPFDFSVQYVAAHPELEPGFAATPEMLDEFRAYLASREFDYEQAEFDEHVDAIALRLRAQVARVKWDRVAEARILAQADTQLQAAIGLFDEAERLARAGRDGTPGAASVASSRASDPDEPEAAATTSRDGGR